MKKSFRLFLIGFSVFFGGLMLLPAVTMLFEMYYLGIDPLVAELTGSTVVRASLATASVVFVTLLGIVSVGYSCYVVATGEEWQ